MSEINHVKKVPTRTTWHSDIEINNGNDYLTLENNPMGCGTMILRRWLFVELEKLEDMLLYIKDLICDNKDSGGYLKLDVDVIFTVVGGKHINSTKLKILKKVGFEEITSYTNARHDGDLQTLFMWNLKEKDE